MEILKNGSGKQQGIANVYRKSKQSAVNVEESREQHPALKE